MLSCGSSIADVPGRAAAAAAAYAIVARDGDGNIRPMGPNDLFVLSYTAPVYSMQCGHEGKSPGK